MVEKLVRALRSARETNPMNDWFLARMVTVQVLAACAIIVAIKS